MDVEADASSNSGATSVTVQNVAPVADDDGYLTSENVALTVSVPGVLAGDSDANGDPLTAILDSGPANGDLMLNADGSFTYTPDPGFVGSDYFRYYASDGYFNSATTRVYIEVTDTGGTGDTFGLDDGAYSWHEGSDALVLQRFQNTAGTGC